jgi:hypothetical protein
MKPNRMKVSLRILLLLVLVLAVVKAAPAQSPPPDEAPPNVAGKWTIYSKSDNGETDTKYIELKQDGEKLTGHFKGPHPSGGMEGTVQGKHIVFGTKTEHVLTFCGQAAGDGMRGRFAIWTPKNGAVHGNWEARRSE